MDDDAIKTATGLCLGVSICRPHHCQHCHVEVDNMDTRTALAVSRVPVAAPAMLPLAA